MNDSQLRTAIAVGLALALAAVLASVMWWSALPAGKAPKTNDPGEKRGQAEILTSMPTPRASAQANDPKLVEIDMLGTRMDAARLFELGFGGGLTVNMETRDSLGALLMAMPDEPTPGEVDKLESTLRQGLPKDDAEKAIRLFHGYTSYQADMKVEAEKLGIPDTPQAVDVYFDRLAQIQRRHFDDATATALFGQDNMDARRLMKAGLSSSEETVKQQ